MTEIHGPACAHSRVRHVTVENTDGTCRDEWWCRDCEGGTQFVPAAVAAGAEAARRIEARAEPTRGVRHNKGKVRWHLVPWDGMQAVADIFEKGAHLYSPRNWEKGLSYSEVFDSLQRHLLSWYRGEDRDPLSGMLHLAHATWNALALLTFTVRGRDDLDDRPNKVELGQ